MEICTFEHLFSQEVQNLSSLLRLSQEAAFRHLCLLGLEGVVEKEGLAWVIIRSSGKIYAPPTGRCRISTWPGKTRAGMMPRYFQIHLPDGTLAMELVSVWMLADVQSRQMRLDLKLPIPDMTRGDELPFPRHLHKMDLPPVGQFTVTDALIDENGHMNNAVYPDTALRVLQENLPLPKSFSVDYRNELLPHSTAQVFALWEEGEERTLHLSGYAQDVESFRMKFTY